jgi:penicillin amidase
MASRSTEAAIRLWAQPRGRVLNRGPYRTGGDGHTVCPGLVVAEEAGPPVYVGASYRQICDTAAWDASCSMHATGQSGHPGSRHYADFVRPWLRLQYHPMLWSRDRVEVATVHRPMLCPDLRSETRTTAR